MSIGAVKIAKIADDAKVPRRASDGAIGYDVFAYHVLDRRDKRPIGELPVLIRPGERALIGIGVIFALPMGHEIQVRPRSGLANKYGIQLLNSPGTIDPDYRGEAGCLLHNVGDKPFLVKKDMRVAQLIFSAVDIPDLVEAALEELDPTRRGEGGFGSTGLIGIGLGTEEYDRERRRLDEYFMSVVSAVAALSNCARGCPRDEQGKYLRDEQGGLVGQTRRFGCVIADGEQVIATGFNKQTLGSKLCAEYGCLRDERGIPSGQQIEVCRAVHAEQMAINVAARSGIPISGKTMYVNAEPCLFCARQIADSGLGTLVIVQGGYGETHGLNIVQDAGIKIRKL